jgi:hypothetical protein
VAYVILAAIAAVSAVALCRARNKPWLTKWRSHV